MTSRKGILPCCLGTAATWCDDISAFRMHFTAYHLGILVERWLAKSFSFSLMGRWEGLQLGQCAWLTSIWSFFFSSEVVAAVPPEVLPYLLLDPLGLVRTCFLGVCCGGAGTSASATCTSAVMAAMMSSSCLE